MTQTTNNAKGKIPRNLSLKFPMVLGLIVSLFCSLSLQAESSSEIKKSEDEIREQMIKISAELGVSCTECHIVTNFKDNQKESFQVALKHIKLVQALKDAGMNGQKGQPEASCFTCHRGQLKYPNKLIPAKSGTPAKAESHHE